MISIYWASRSVVSDSLRPYGLFVARQAPLSMEFSRQECWSRLPFPPLGDLPNPRIEPASSVSLALQADSLPADSSGSEVTGQGYKGMNHRSCASYNGMG